MVDLYKNATNRSNNNSELLNETSIQKMKTFTRRNQMGNSKEIIKPRMTREISILKDYVEHINALRFQSKEIVTTIAS